MEIDGATLGVYLRELASGYERALDRFDDDTVNRKPHGEHTNSGAVIVTHAWASARYWIDHVGLGRPSDRVRDEEFVAVATVAELKALVRARAQHLVESVRHFDHGLTGNPHQDRCELPEGDGSDGSIVIHAFEELFQHLGHLELTADALTAPR